MNLIFIISYDIVKKVRIVRKEKLARELFFTMEIRISSKGQITLPVEARRKLGIKTGDVLKVRLTEEGLVVLPGKARLNNDLAGALKVLRETSGIWKGMEETGEDFVRRLRSEDNERWKVLGLD